MNKLIEFGDVNRNKIKNGINILADAVSATMGPKGRNVIIGKHYGPPSITKDGVTVAREVDLEDPLENVGAQAVKEVAQKTAEDAGDGTTTATVLARAIFIEGLKLVAAGHDPMSLKRGIDYATKKVVNYLEDISKEVTSEEEIAHVASISANNEYSIGSLIADAMSKVGKDGLIHIEDQVRGFETSLERVEGMQIDRGYIHPMFMTNADTMSAEYKECYILIYDGTINSIANSNIVDFLTKINEVAKHKGKPCPVLIIADSVEGECLALLVMNKNRGVIPSVAIRSPEVGQKKKDYLADIAAITGGQVLSRENDLLDLSKVNLSEHLGIASSITVTKDFTTIIGGVGDKDRIQERINQIKYQMETADEVDSKFLRERLARIIGGVAIINVGGSTEVEIKEKKDRVEDALSATRAAVEEGIIPGGGIALLRASREVKIDCPEEQKYGANILLKACEEPISTIARNAGDEPEVIKNKVLSFNSLNLGYNAFNGKIEDLMEAGVIDPKKVVRSALENAASIAGLLLTTEVMIAEKYKPAVENN